MCGAREGGRAGGLLRRRQEAGLRLSRGYQPVAAYYHLMQMTFTNDLCKCMCC